MGHRGVNEQFSTGLLGSTTESVTRKSPKPVFVSPMLDLNFLSKQANLPNGAKVYTSGVGGVFPSGLLVGVIQSFKVRELDSQARVTPAVDLSHLEDVFVVTGRK